MRVHPPVHWLVAGFVGYKPPAEEPQPANFAAAREKHAAWFRAPQRFMRT